MFIPIELSLLTLVSMHLGGPNLNTQTGVKLRTPLLQSEVSNHIFARLKAGRVADASRHTLFRTCFLEDLEIS